MAKVISSKKELIRYIRSQLGEPQITIEVNDVQISEIIDATCDKFTEVAYGDYERVIDVDLSTASSRISYDGTIFLPEFNNVLRVFEPGKWCPKNPKSGNVDFHWASFARKLTLLNVKKRSASISVLGLTNYEVNDDMDYIFNESWVREYSKAHVKLLWGQIVGKYSQSLVGGATINFDRMISEAQEEIAKLEEELLEKWQDPAPVDVV